MSHTARNLRESLRSSTGLAVLGSVGFHILLAALPVCLLTPSGRIAGATNCRTDELGPAEQSRLPQGSGFRVARYATTAVSTRVYYHPYHPPAYRLLAFPCLTIRPLPQYIATLPPHL